MNAFEEIKSSNIAAIGVARIRDFFTFDVYKKFVDCGMPPGLQYLVRNCETRRSIESILPGAKSAICIAIHLPPASSGWARFCSVGDYHLVVREKLSFVETILRKVIPLGETRICVDSAPVLERELAVLAGLGAIAKNHMLVHPHFGSGIVIGELFSTFDVCAYASLLSKNTISFQPSNLIPGAACNPRCSECCMNSCPTSALTHDSYNPSRCLAYLTTQHTGPLDDEFVAAMGNVVWGCDRCQSSCPVARHITTLEPVSFLQRLSPELILSSSSKQLVRELAGTPMAAAHPRILQRNACYVIGNARQTYYIPLLKTVAAQNPCEWVKSAALLSLKKLIKIEGEVSP